MIVREIDMARKSHMLENLALMSLIGIAMLLPIIAAVYLGRWLDKIFNSQPIFLFVLIILGVIVSFINLFKVAGMGKDSRKGKS